MIAATALIEGAPLQTREVVRSLMRGGSDTFDIASAYHVSEAEIWNVLAGVERPPPPPPRQRRKPGQALAGAARLPPPPAPLPRKNYADLGARIIADRVVHALNRPDGLSAAYLAEVYSAPIGRANDAIVLLSQRGEGRIERRNGGIAHLILFSPIPSPRP